MILKEVRCGMAKNERVSVEDAQRRMMKAGMVMESPDAVNLLAVLQRLRRISVQLLQTLRTDTTDMAIAVGMLAAAGFCDVWPDAISITPDGDAFIEFFSRKKAEKPSGPE